MSKSKSTLEGSEKVLAKGKPGIAIREDSAKEILNGIFQAGKQSYIDSIPSDSDAEKKLKGFYLKEIASIEKKILKSL